jgi:hypothetical protein
MQGDSGLIVPAGDDVPVRHEERTTAKLTEKTSSIGERSRGGLGEHLEFRNAERVVVGVCHIEVGRMSGSPRQVLSRLRVRMSITG